MKWFKSIVIESVVETLACMAGTAAGFVIWALAQDNRDS